VRRKGKEREGKRRERDGNGQVSEWKVVEARGERKRRSSHH